MVPRSRFISVLLTLGLGVFVLGGPSMAWSHEGHRSKSKAPNASKKVEERSSDTPASPERPEGTGSPGGPSGAAWVPRESGPEGPEPGEGVRPLRVLWRQQLFAHMHNKIVHFPIALGLMGAVLALLSRRWPQYESAARLLIGVAALFALAAYFAGEAQAEDFEGSELEQVLEWHERLGVTTTVLLWLGVVVSWTPPARRWLWVWALIVLVLIPVTGFFGGILAHAE